MPSEGIIWGTRKWIGSLSLDGIAGFSTEDPHAAPPAPRCWRPRRFSEKGSTPGLGREPILLIPGEMLEFDLIQFEMRQDLLADGSPLR